MPARVTYDRRKLDEYIKRAAALQKLSVEITAPQILLYHEFGAGNLPERSSIRWTVQAKRREIADATKAASLRYLAGHGSLQDAGDAIGKVFAGEVQKRLRSGVPPELDDDTKGSDFAGRPLATLADDIGWKVVLS
jgi:hypothetical protein